MTGAPAIFRRNIAQHNRHCWIAAGLSFLGALLAWVLLAAAFTGLVLLSESLRTGDPGLRDLPPWFRFALPAVIAGLFICAYIDRVLRRYRPVNDRSIIGWHLIPDCVLAPARMTFAIWDHVSLRVTLSARQRDEAWRLLEIIAEQRRSVSSLGQFFPDPSALPQLLLALQLTGWIDLHRGDEDWFYALRSDAEQNYRLLRG